MLILGQDFFISELGTDKLSRRTKFFTLRQRQTANISRLITITIQTRYGGITNDRVTLGQVQLAELL
jgi:hypothetical protein